MAAASVKFPFVLQRESVHLRTNHFPSCLQSCDVFRAAKNELLQQSLEGTLEKDLAYFFFGGGGGRREGVLRLRERKRLV